MAMLNNQRVYYIYTLVLIYQFIYIYGGCPKLWYPKTALTPRFCEPFAPFRAPAESGHGIMIGFSFIYRFINSTMRPFANLTPRFRGLSPLQQNIHIHLCRCHSDTKSLAWVLGRLPYIYTYIYISRIFYCHVWLLECNSSNKTHGDLKQQRRSMRQRIHGVRVFFTSVAWNFDLKMRNHVGKTMPCLPSPNKSPFL